MKQTRYQQVRDVFHAAASAPVENRRECIEQLCGKDHALRAEVESLLDEIEAPSIDLEISAIPSSVRRAPPRTLGRYRILEVLGEGGGGVVYRAEQEQPRRLVALKLLRAASPRMRRRFDLEMEVLGRLHHQGIVQIFEGGVDDGHTFIAMELVEGNPLQVWLEGDPTHDARLRVLIEVCAAVQHAHHNAVVHRDLKPPNILVDRDGHARVLDFGIARLLADHASESVLTIDGQLLGTPAYMSPEQIAHGGDGVDTRSDVYALGVITFMVLTGRLPYDLPEDATPVQLMRAIEEQPPLRAGAIDETLRGDGETILSRALEKDPDRRYATAEALGRDLEHWRRGEPIDARRDSIAYMLHKRLQRWRAAVIATLFALMALGAFGVYSTIQATRYQTLAMSESQARGDANVARVSAETARGSAEREAEQTRLLTSYLIDLVGRADLDEHQELGGTVLGLMEAASEDLSIVFGGRPQAEAELRTRLGRAFFTHGENRRAATELIRAARIENARRPADEQALYAALWPYLEILIDERQHHTRGSIRSSLMQIAYNRFAQRSKDLERLLLELRTAAGTGSTPADAESAIAEIENAAATELHTAEDWGLLADQFYLHSYLVRFHRPNPEVGVLLLEAALRIHRQHLAPTNTRIARAALALVDLLVMSGAAQEARLIATELLETMRSHLAADHWFVGVCETRLAATLLELEQVGEARERLDRGIELITAAHGPLSNLLIDPMQTKIRLTVASGDAEDAATARMDLVRIVGAGSAPLARSTGDLVLGDVQDSARILRDAFHNSSTTDPETLATALERLDDVIATLPLETDGRAEWLQLTVMRAGARVLQVAHDDPSHRMARRAADVARQIDWAHPGRRADTLWWLAYNRWLAGDLAEVRRITAEAQRFYDIEAAAEDTILDAVIALHAAAEYRLRGDHRDLARLEKMYARLSAYLRGRLVYERVCCDWLIDIMAERGDTLLTSHYVKQLLIPFYTTTSWTVYKHESARRASRLPDLTQDVREFAIEVIEQALRRKPDDLDVRRTYGACLYRAGRFDEALVELEASDAARDVSAPEYVAFLAMTLHALGRHADAAAELDRLRSLPTVTGDERGVVEEAQRIVGRRG